MYLVLYRKLNLSYKFHVQGEGIDANYCPKTAIFLNVNPAQALAQSKEGKSIVGMTKKIIKEDGHPNCCYVPQIIPGNGHPNKTVFSCTRPRNTQEFIVYFISYFFYI